MRKSSNSLALFEVYDDSMAPFISGGDIVLTDLSENEPGAVIDGKAYAICEEGTVKIRRLARQGGRLIIRSQDRDNFPDYEAGEDFSIVGRVTWEKPGQTTVFNSLPYSITMLINMFPD